MLGDIPDPSESMIVFLDEIHTMCAFQIPTSVREEICIVYSSVHYCY